MSVRHYRLKNGDRTQKGDIEMNAKSGIPEHVLHELRRYSVRCVAGLMIAGMIVAAPVQSSYAMTEEAEDSQSPAVEIEECITSENDSEAGAAEAAANEAKEEAAQDMDAEDSSEAAAISEITDAEVPLAAEAVKIEDEAVPMVLSADVFENDEMKEESEDIDITIKGMFTEGTGVKAWPVKAEGKEFAAYQIIITDAKGREIHSESGDGNEITVTINDPELTKGLDARKNIAGSHKDNGGRKDADFEYEILDDGSVRFEADVF